jgi:1,4-alpha-glucan branching enzyme
MSFARAYSSSLTSEDLAALQDARHDDPFSVLGPHRFGEDVVIRAFYPGAAGVDILCVECGERPMVEIDPGLFETWLTSETPYRLRIHWAGSPIITHDPYAIPPVLSDYELALISQGRYWDLPLKLGANHREIGGVEGVLFAVWAPNARSVAVVGDFNAWDPRRNPMRLRGSAGVWELFVPGLDAGETYKFRLRDRDGRVLPLKADPLARQAENPPKTGSIVAPPPDFKWSDEAWMASRAARQSRDAPISIYEVHVDSWLRYAGREGHGGWDEACERLIPYAVGLGFTHIELMPIAEYPFGGSWGYQPLSLFAPTSRLGDPASFARFVDRCHAAGIGVLVDWVPAHFPTDEHGMARFDGTALYEHLDPKEGFHRDWNTYIYNLGRHEVKGFLIASALWWLERFHVDGLRVDAVASMLYRDYSREPGDWVPNIYGGNENLESVSFLRELNAEVRKRVPGAIMVAEESTAWAGITDPGAGGLGFHFKWNMGWMHDTLVFFERDPIHRRYNLDDVLFGLTYGFSEAFILPISHDEVVHGKKSLLGRMHGDDWNRFAHLRLFLAMMWTHPGKKLLFMGCEFGAENEFDADAPFPWPHPHDALRQGVSRLVRDLNALMREHPALHKRDGTPDGFKWVVADDAENTVFAFCRRTDSEGDELLVVANCTPVPRTNYEIGVRSGGRWREVFNSDATIYGGSGWGNFGGVYAYEHARHGEGYSINLSLPPLGLLVLRHER